MMDDGTESGCLFFDKEDDLPPEDPLFDVKVVSIPMLYDVL